MRAASEGAFALGVGLLLPMAACGGSNVAASDAAATEAAAGEVDGGPEAEAAMSVGPSEGSVADAAELNVDEASQDAAPGAPPGFLRIAHLSPDAPPLDVCVAPHATAAFQGPLFAGLATGVNGAAPSDDAQAPDAGVTGVAYARVSAYVSLPAGQYDVRLVAAVAGSCDVPWPAGASPPNATTEAGIEADASQEAADAAAVDGEAGAEATAPASASQGVFSLAPNTSATLLVAGDLSPVGVDAPLTVTVLADDAILASGGAEMRAVNAVPSFASIDFGLGSGAEWLPLLTDVKFGAASAGVAADESAVDANGYLPILPAPQTLSARVSSEDAGADLAVASNVNVAVGSIATVFAIGGKTGDANHPPALLVCFDNQPSGGLFADCSVGMP
jgi:hypothetical protein